MRIFESKGLRQKNVVMKFLTIPENFCTLGLIANKGDKLNARAI